MDVRLERACLLPGGAPREMCRCGVWINPGSWTVALQGGGEVVTMFKDLNLPEKLFSEKNVS